jgi:hypothetical protein
MGITPETIFGPDMDVDLLVYSEGWGEDGKGAAIIYLTDLGSGNYQWFALLYSFEQFDKYCRYIIGTGAWRLPQ